MSAFADNLARLRASHPEPLVSHVEDPVVRAGVGWSVWERTPEGSDYDPRGGVVLHVDVAPDPETGEIGDRYLVVRADRGRLVWGSLRAEAVTCPGRPNAHTIRGVCSIAARELSGARRRPDDARDLELWSLGTRLMATLARPDSGGPPPGAG